MSNERKNKGIQQTIRFDADDVPAQTDILDNDTANSINEIIEAGNEAKAPVAEPEKTLRFISFGSGSSGNCSYVGTETEGVIIDAGVDIDKVFESLAANGVRPEMVKGLCITHDHGDHIRYAYTMARKYKHIRVYCTPRVLNGILRRHNISRRLKDVHEAIFKEIPFKLAGMQFTAFDVSHDSSDNVGYSIEYGDKHFVIATDMGYVTDRSSFYMKQANYLMIEANYDEVMLDTGKYPEYLKNRIRSNTGHLDNKETAKFVSESYTDALRYVFLCHLSHDNNTPEIATKEVRDALEAKGVTVGNGEGSIEDRTKALQLVALPRFDDSRWFVLRK